MILLSNVRLRMENSSISNVSFSFEIGNEACNDGTIVGLLIFLRKIFPFSE